MEITKKDLRRVKQSLNLYSNKYKGHPLTNLGNKVTIENCYNRKSYKYILEYDFEKRIVSYKNKSTRKTKFKKRQITNVSQVSPWEYKIPKRYFNLKKIKTFKIPLSSIHKTCGNCKGSKNVTCDTCKGSKFFSCSTCNKTGTVKCHCIGGSQTCPNCNWGRARCAYCGGSGETTTGLKGVYNKCQVCYGRGSKTCGTCSGTGSITCRTCRGSRQKRCTSCNGSLYVNCSGCRGRGYRSCGSCDGKGGFELYIGIDQSFNKSSLNDFYMSETIVLRDATIDAELIKTEKLEGIYKSKDFYNSISDKVKSPLGPIKNIVKILKSDTTILPLRQKLKVYSFSQIEFTYNIDDHRYEGVIIGKDNVLLTNGCPITEYAQNQLREINQLISSELYYQAFKILKRIKGLPSISQNDIRTLQNLILSKLKRKKGIKYYKQKLKISLLGRIKIQ